MHLLGKYGMGVHSLIVWGDIGSERVVISEYSISYNTLPQSEGSIRPRRLLSESRRIKICVLRLSTYPRQP